MKSKLFFIAVLFLSITSMYAQDIFTTSNAKVSFHSKTPVEDIEAISNKVSSVLNIKTKQIYFKIQNTTFQFKEKLMQEHFNENYMESDKLPKASFKGKVLNYKGKAGSYDVEGDLTIHGVANKVKTKMAVAIDGEKLMISGAFTIKLLDYKIDVPALAKKTLSETAKISIKLVLENK